MSFYHITVKDSNHYSGFLKTFILLSKIMILFWTRNLRVTRP